MIKLTDWETGDPLYVNEKMLLSVSRLKASISHYGITPTELGARTRIVLTGDNGCFLVREMPDEVISANPITTGEQTK